MSFFLDPVIEEKGIDFFSVLIPVEDFSALIVPVCAK